jgi:hypothetical protein
VKLLGKISRTVLAIVGATVLRPSLWPIALAIVVLGMSALAIIAGAAFTKRRVPMERLRAFVRDVRGGQ